MLTGIGRWLRADGYDTAIARDGAQDEELLAQAGAGDRIVLTCDRDLAARCAPAALVLLATESPDEAALPLRERLAIDWLHAPFSRCLLDNAQLRPAALARLRERSRKGAGPITSPPSPSLCGRLGEDT
jgi:uncharacterized protein with PIN domain